MKTSLRRLENFNKFKEVSSKADKKAMAQADEAYSNVSQRISPDVCSQKL
jgi:hypothetical protein